MLFSFQFTEAIRKSMFSNITNRSSKSPLFNLKSRSHLYESTNLTHTVVNVCMWLCNAFCII